MFRALSIDVQRKTRHPMSKNLRNHVVINGHNLDDNLHIKQKFLHLLHPHQNDCVSFNGHYSVEHLRDWCDRCDVSKERPVVETDEEFKNHLQQ
jgi:hypothetical protein